MNTIHTSLIVMNIPQQPERKLSRMGDRIQEVLDVLDDFFIKTDKGYINNRCEKEIAKYYEAKKNHWGNKLTKTQRCALQATRNASKINATPRWLTDNHKAQIAEIYAKAALITAQTNIKHEVDHVIPLRGGKVSGLHVPWNLAVIPAHENRKKSNLLLGSV